MQLHVFLAAAPYQAEALNRSPFLEEMMQLQALRPGIRHAVAVFAFAGLAVASGAYANPAGPSASGNGLSLRPGATSASHDVPFAGRLDGTYTLSFPNPQTLVVSGQGTGHATHLGQFTFNYDEVVDLSTGIGTGTYAFTAANGDTLTAGWTGQGFPTEDPTVLLIVENATITSGTGRFVTASGSFTVERLFSFVSNSGGGSFDGTIGLH